MTDSPRFLATHDPRGFWAVKDTDSSALPAMRLLGTLTTFLTWPGMTEAQATAIAARYNAGFRPA